MKKISLLLFLFIFFPFDPTIALAQNCSAFSYQQCGNFTSLSCGSASGCTTTDMGNGYCYDTCRCENIIQQGSTFSGWTTGTFPNGQLYCAAMYEGPSCQVVGSSGGNLSGPVYLCGGGGGGQQATTDYTLNMTPTTRSIIKGETTTYSLSVNPISAMDNVTVNLSVSGCPSGATCTFTGGNSVTMAAPASGVTKTLVVTSTNMAPGTHTLTVTGTGNGVTRTSSASLLVSGGANNALCLSITAPDTVTPGQQFQFSARFRNTGTKTWAYPSPGVGHRLGSWNPNDVDIWGPWTARTDMGAGVTVAPNGEITFSRTLTAPTTPQNYNFQFAMLEEGVEWITGPGAVCVKPGGVTVVPSLNVSIVPSATSVTAGQQVTFTVTASSGSGLDSVGLEGLNSSGVPVSNLGETPVTGNSTTRTFNWTSSTPGTFYFGGYAWSAGRASLLRTSPPVVVTVSSATPPLASQCVSMSLTDTSGNPITSVTTGQAFRALVNMRNTGANTWTPSGANNYHLTTMPWNSSNPWSYARTIIGTTVATNGQHTFTLNLTAPATAGTYPLQTQMLQEGVAWFGESCSFPLGSGGGGGITVNSRTNNAECVSVSAPASVVAGSTFTGTITMRNTGTKPWTAAFTPPNGQGHKLGSSNPRSNSVWGSNSVRMLIPNGTTINQNQTYAFSTTFTAPSVAGTYPFTFEMLEEAVQWFGPVCSPSVNSGNITVTPAPITQFTLTVNKTIGGNVTSTDGLISCGATCVRQYNQGSTVTLQAIPDTAQWRFAGWGGACSGTPVTSNCVITVNGNTSVTAQFRPRALQYQEF